VAATVVGSIAKRLGWGFLTVDTSQFLADGTSNNIAARVSYIFERLLELTGVVILFDDIDPTHHQPWLLTAC
jgi:glucosamine 6-phosphate synthetase-like amidotransferase/phosphosugar isomerase protein